jgi:hypothetical protein
LNFNEREATALVEGLVPLIKGFLAAQ